MTSDPMSHTRKYTRESATFHAYSARLVSDLARALVPMHQCPKTASGGREGRCQLFRLGRISCFFDYGLVSTHRLT